MIEWILTQIYTANSISFIYWKHHLGLLFSNSKVNFFDNIKSILKLTPGYEIIVINSIIMHKHH